MMNRRALLRSGAALMGLWGVRGACADTWDGPGERGYPVLSVMRARPGQAPEQLAEMTLAELSALPQRELETALPPSFEPGGTPVWRGPLLADILAAQGAPSPRAIRVGALNGYMVDIPESDLERFAPLLAWQRDGSTMSIRERGPLILMYPYDQHPELTEQIRYLNRMVWQVDKVTALY